MKIANVAAGNGKPNWSRICAWLKKRRPDIVTLQKTGEKESFPNEVLCNIGYTSELLGKRNSSDLGVAILICRSFPQPVILQGPDHEEESRFLTVRIGDLVVSSVYAPFNPEDEKPKQAIKRRAAWLNRLRNHVTEEGYSREKSLLCGDFNVKFKADGRRKNDNYYKQDEEDALQKLIDLGFCDLYRVKHRSPIKGHTRGYDRNPEEGTSRLHLMLASKCLAQGCRSVWLDDNREYWPRPDAPPLIADLDVEL